jgi:hypothetical protein
MLGDATFEAGNPVAIASSPWGTTRGTAAARLVPSLSFPSSLRLADLPPWLICSDHDAEIPLILRVSGCRKPMAEDGDLPFAPFFRRSNIFRFGKIATITKIPDFVTRTIQLLMTCHKNFKLSFSHAILILQKQE